MAVLSPALALAMCVMFILTRLHHHFYIFERPFLFGLGFCLEPDRNQLAALVNEKAQKSLPSVKGKKKGKTAAKPANSTKPKISIASLPVRRSKLSETFFSAEAEFPHHKELDHLMSICCGFVVAYLFEDILSCFYPRFLLNFRSGYVGVFAVGFAVFEAWRISLSLAMRRIILVITCIAWLFAMVLLSAGDFSDFFKFDQAFAGLRASFTDVLTTRLGADDDAANGYGRIFTITARFLVATAAAFIAGAFAVPARRFAMLDYEMHLHYRRDEAEEREDPYSLGPPKPLTMLIIALDYVLPFLAVLLWCTSPRDIVYGPWRIYSLLACVVVRFAGLRIRLQKYLDKATDVYRRFWTEQSSLGIAEAGQRVSTEILGTSFYLIMITMAYVAPALVTLVTALMAKLDGGIASGLCLVKESLAPSPFQSFAREIAGFLSWWSVLCYAFFGSLSLLSDVALDILEPGARDRRGKLPIPTSSSEKRKHRRLLQEQLAKTHAAHQS